MARRAALSAAVMVTLVAAGAPSPAPLGIGDRLFPHLGNPGYDVRAYDIAFDYSGSNREPLRAVTSIDARATESLSRLNLDFARGEVRSVEVNGEPARFRTVGEDLAVTPAEPVADGAPLRMRIAHTSSTRGSDGGWLRTEDGLAMANQPDAAHRVFPCNDHPSDKARFTFRITTPPGLTAVASGLRLSGEDADRGISGEGTGRAPGRKPRAADGRTTWTYRGVHPMAPELAQVSIGRSAVIGREGPHDLPMRDVVPAADRGRLGRWLAKTPAQISWMESKVGPYPFENYGVLIAAAETGFELETQTLSLFERGLFTDSRYPEPYVESVMVHELAHQWFGDSVSPERWTDLWLNEAHATWYEALYAEEKADVSLTERMRQAYASSDGWRAEGGPPADPKVPDPGSKISIFRPIAYDGSALVLYALRERIGTAAFDRLQRAWVTRHRDSHASTADFIALASEISGKDQSGFLRPWLYATKTPPMPGHPEWRSERHGTGIGTLLGPVLHPGKHR